MIQNINAPPGDGTGSLSAGTLGGVDFSAADHSPA